MIWLSWLTDEINKFVLLQERIGVVGGRDTQIENEMIRIYENILKNFETYNNSSISGTL